MSEGQSLSERCKNYLSEKYGKLERQAAFEYNQHLREHEKSLKKLSKKSIGYLSGKYTELKEYVTSKYDQHLGQYERHLPEQVIENKGLITGALIVMGGVGAMELIGEDLIFGHSFLNSSGYGLGS